MLNRLKSTNYIALKGILLKSKEIRNSLNFAEASKQKKAVENGATSVLEPELEPWGQRTCYIADPEGNLIELGSWNKPYEEKNLEGV